MSSYKDTVRLPKTDFPMKAGLAQREPDLLAKWKKEGLYDSIQKAREGSPKYVLHDGPPFANGDVHMGTALNKVLKDLVVKSKTMAGFQAPFIPGWDCHGLPIEFRVVKSSAGLTPLQVRQKSEEYARKFIDIQRTQFRRLGVFGDWDHPYLTLDPSYEAAIICSFGRMVEKGLVYRSKKPVLWSTGAQTALAEAEVEYQDKTSPAIFVKFVIETHEAASAGLPTDKPLSVVIWTTTPWTLPANLAIAVHADFDYVLLENAAERLIVAAGLSDKFKESTGLELSQHGESRKGATLEGLKSKHPFLDRHATVHTAEFVTLETGSGCVHIAPGHGDDDYQLGRRVGLELLSPVDDYGKFTEECGVPSLVGQNVFEGNEEVIRILTEKGALLGRQDYQHSYPHCWRSKTPILFRAVEQFFIRIDALRETALKEIDATNWIPHWGRNRIRGTVESRPDWCISRQRSWGVPLPVFYTPEGEPILDPSVIAKVSEVVAEKGSNSWFALDDAEWCRLTGAPVGSVRRNDTLDVWIDSGMSHEAVLRGRPELQFPADLYLEATDQHRGWFQSSLMTSVALNEKAPYKTVLTHGFVVDVDTRQKISKSNQGQGGYQKPTEADHFVKTYGADIVRLWASSVQFTDDVPFSEEIFARLTDSYRRIRNTLRILLANLSDYDATAPVAEPTLIDRWILARLQETVNICRKAYEELAFQKAYQAITQFCTVELSSIYVDVTKDRLYCDTASSARRRATQSVMAKVFGDLVCLLAPILAFTAEEAWGHFRPEGSVHLELFPEEKTPDQDILARFESLQALRGDVSQSLEKAQRDGLIGKPLEATVDVSTDDPLVLRAVENGELAEIEEFLILSNLSIGKGAKNVTIGKTEDSKCERCWRHREEVGSHATHPTLCGRCVDAVESLGASPAAA
ncbi:MAG: isoleucine--tRNA ligase [Verrucomicrobiota bacterium]